MHITFNDPTPLSLQELAQLTASSLAFLEPWYNAKEDETSPTLLSISVKAHKYTAAIDDSVKAAQYGFDVAGSALQLSELVKKDGASKEECDNFAKIMLTCASKAYVRAHESLEKFRNVRQDLTELISNARKSGDHHHVKDDLDNLEKGGIPIFEKLVKCVSNYIDWWRWIAMRTRAEKSISEQQLTLKYTKIRGQNAMKKWAELQENFVQYTLEIGKLEDAHPSMFTKTIEAKLETPTTEADDEHRNIGRHVEQIAAVQNTRKRPLASRAWKSFSSFAQSLICL